MIFSNSIIFNILVLIVMKYLYRKDSQIQKPFFIRKNSTLARAYPGEVPTPNNLNRVLFEVDADPLVVTTKPFADSRIHPIP